MDYLKIIIILYLIEMIQIIQDFLAFADGELDLIDLANVLDIPIKDLISVANILYEQKLIRVIE